MPDERPRLIFTCCHPALALEAQVALTLPTLCVLSTEGIARGFLASDSGAEREFLLNRRAARVGAEPDVQGSR